MTSNHGDIIWRTRAIILAPMFIGFVIVVIGLFVEGPEGDRIFPGGLCLVMASIAGIAAYSQIESGAVIYRESFWSSRMKSGDKKEHPHRYWFTTVLYVVCSVVLFAYSIAIFAYTMDVIGAR